ncbi:unnamed protein product [Soboliphyme baturini]|uniref:Helicase C-terminal domain-containing protein n=1 Tax=Soboliphyme baturini TaxID=241478 RepID=A0A183J7C3_9BILA|nr:unnamed protein product [Soboliphyme baturini]
MDFIAHAGRIGRHGKKCEWVGGHSIPLRIRYRTHKTEDFTIFGLFDVPQNCRRRTVAAAGVEETFREVRSGRCQALVAGGLSPRSLVLVASRKRKRRCDGIFRPPPSSPLLVPAVSLPRRSWLVVWPSSSSFSNRRRTNDRSAVRPMNHVKKSFRPTWHRWKPRLPLRRLILFSPGVKNAWCPRLIFAPVIRTEKFKLVEKNCRQRAARHNHRYLDVGVPRGCHIDFTSSLICTRFEALST